MEPLISSVSWLMNHGQPLYHEINSPARYSVLYGPSVYLTNGLFLQIFDPNLAVTKLPSLLAGILSLFFLYVATARTKVDRIAALAVLLAILFYWNQGFSIYLVRPDAFLVFAVGFGLVALTRTRGLLAALAMGAALGYAINLKIHAGFYFLPLLVLFQQRNGWRLLSGSLVVGLLLTLAPFMLHPQISGINYILWIKNAAGHGLCVETITDTCRYAVALVLPLALILAMDGNVRRNVSRDRNLYLSILASLMGILVLSTKPGAGLVHLLPLVPVMVFLAADKAQTMNHQHWCKIDTTNSRLFRGRCAMAALFIAIFFTGSIHTYRSSCLVEWQNRDSEELAEDIEGILNDYSDLKISMACGGEDEFFRSTWMRPLLVFADNPVLIDPIAVMDCRKAGLEISEGTFKAIENGKVGMWLVPRNQKPFQKTNWYAPHDVIFPERFLDYFVEHYTRQGHTRFFDLWFWNGLKPKLPVQGSLAAGGVGSQIPDGKMAK